MLQLTRLHKLQNKAARSILQLNMFTPIAFMLDILDDGLKCVKG